MKLYGYFRSSAAYRVRIGLNLKGLRWEHAFVHLVRGGGEQKSPEYRALNPQALVPALETDDGAVLTQSLAVLEYLDETHPLPPLLPADPLGRARVRALAQAIACDIHPLNNLRVLQYLSKTLGVDDDAKNAWYRHWVEIGLAAVEEMLKSDPQVGDFCGGDQPGLADCCLIPQVFNARRFNCDVSGLTVVNGIVERCAEIPAFRDAAPENQPDFE